MGVVGPVITVHALVLVREGSVERVAARHVGSEVLESGSGDTGLAGKDVHAVGAIERDFLLKMYDVGVRDTGYGGWSEDTAGAEEGAGVLGREEAGVL